MDFKKWDREAKALNEDLKSERLTLKVFLLLVGAMALAVVIVLLCGCVSSQDVCDIKNTLEQIREADQKSAINTGATADTIQDPVIQARRQAALKEVEPAKSATPFPWSELIVGLLLSIIAGVQVSKYGSIKNIAKTIVGVVANGQDPEQKTT